MSTTIIHQSSIERTVRVPQTARLIDLEAQIKEIRAEQQRVLSSIVADCEFMDVPVLTVLDHDCGARKPAPGDLCHVLYLEEERTGTDRHEVHLAEGCSDWMCELPGRTKYPKYAHVGSRYWATPLSDHIAVGSEEFQDQSIWGTRTKTRHTLIPVATPARSVAG